MKRPHFKAMKIHTVFNLILLALLLVLSIWQSSANRWLALGLVILYVVGNGYIHIRKSELTRDTLIEYAIVAFIALVLLAGTFM